MSKVRVSTEIAKIGQGMRFEVLSKSFPNLCVKHAFSVDHLNTRQQNVCNFLGEEVVAYIPSISSDQKIDLFFHIDLTPKEVLFQHLLDFGMI